MIPDVYINNQSLFSMGWLRESADFPTPKSQTNTITVPGRNTPVRFMEGLGLKSYQPREFSIVLSMLGDRNKYNSMYKKAINSFSGKLCEVTLSEEAELYAVGTLELTPEYNPLTGKGTLTIECKDGDSYRYYKDITEVSLSGSGVFSLTNDYMPVVPEIEVTSETTLNWIIDDTSFEKTVSPGTWVIPELQFFYGENNIGIATEGSVTFRYREGCL